MTHIRQYHPFILSKPRSEKSGKEREREKKRKAPLVVAGSQLILAGGYDYIYYNQ